MCNQGSVVCYVSRNNGCNHISDSKHFNILLTSACVFNIASRLSKEEQYEIRHQNGCGSIQIDIDTAMLCQKAIYDARICICNVQRNRASSHHIAASIASHNSAPDRPPGSSKQASRT